MKKCKEGKKADVHSRIRPIFVHVYMTRPSTVASKEHTVEETTQKAERCILRHQIWNIPLTSSLPPFARLASEFE